MVDIHCHILPSVDDGPRKIEDSLIMLAKASASGIKTIVATPHLLEGISNKRISICNRAMDELKNTAIKEGIEINILGGFECYITPEFQEKNIDLTDVTINRNGKYILIELPMQNIPMYAKSVFDNMKDKGIIPVIAHPERNFAICKDPNILFDFIYNGCITQLNVGSILGYYGRGPRETAKILLSHNLIHLIASDMHSISSPSVSQALPAIEAIIGIAEASRMSNEVPYHVIMGEDFTRADPIPYNPKKGIKDILFGWKRKNN
jgi:protein-tyrosine phosphatase